MGAGRGRYAIVGTFLAVAGMAALGSVRGGREDADGDVKPMMVAPAAPDAAGFLAALSGTPPIACALVVRTVGNRWGSGSVRPYVRVPLGETPEERALAEWSWSSRLTAADTETLFQGLGATDPCVRRVAATLLAAVADPDVRSRIRRRVADTRGPERLAALTALAGREDTASAALLRDLLANADVELRRSAAWGLGTMEARSSRQALEAVLRDPDVGVRVNAAWALGRIEDRAAIPALSALLATDREAEVRIAAAWALGQVEG